jgi:hypothetical protein
LISTDGETVKVTPSKERFTSTMVDTAEHRTVGTMRGDPFPRERFTSTEWVKAYQWVIPCAVVD